MKKLFIAIPLLIIVSVLSLVMKLFSDHVLLAIIASTLVLLLIDRIPKNIN